MDEKDKTIEVMKAAMEKEKKMKEEMEASKENSMETENTEEADTTKVHEESDKIIGDNAEDPTGNNDTNTEETKENSEDNAEEAMNPDDEKSDEDTVQKKIGKFFKNNKSKELEEKDKKIEELSDRIMRTMAEFDNFRKRTEKEKSQMFDLGVKSVIEKLLPIIDNFERGLNAISEEEKESAFAKGVEMIYKQLLTALEEIGVKPIDAVGKEFDPNLHNAVMHGEDETLGSNIVSDEFQKGYIYHDIVVRHSMVKVVN